MMNDHTVLRAVVSLSTTEHEVHTHDHNINNVPTSVSHLRYLVSYVRTRASHSHFVRCTMYATVVKLPQYEPTPTPSDDKQCRYKIIVVKILKTSRLAPSNQSVRRLGAHAINTPATIAKLVGH